MSETNTVSPLRQRMIEDMAARKLVMPASEKPTQQRTHALQQIASLLDLLVDAGEQRRRHIEAERLG